jgi:hypothetical protein|tara:strand:+ start:947 stop:1180 length:234 start_codon:yes stop_codon:yes gene_type:complete
LDLVAAVVLVDLVVLVVLKEMMVVMVTTLQVQEMVLPEVEVVQDRRDKIILLGEQVVMVDMVSKHHQHLEIQYLQLD